MIYLDYAATTPLRSEALEAMLPYLREDFGNPDSLHMLGRRAALALQDARDTIAAILGVKSAEVYFTAGGTEADNWAVRCTKAAERGIVVSAIEHHAVLEAAQLASREGRTVRYLSVGREGAVSPEALADISGDAGLVGVMAVNNETGVMQPVAQLAAAAHARGALFFSDCVQAACSCELKPLAAVCDLLSLSAHKVGGPKGVGVLVIKKGVRMSPLIAGGEQERGLRGGTVNVAGAVGFAKALALSVREREDFVRHTQAMRARFEARVVEKLGDAVTVDGGRRAPNISHLTFAGGGPALLGRMDLKGLACSAGAACAAHSTLPSHVMTAMGKSADEARAGLRFSFGLQTTETEALAAAEIVVGSYRNYIGGNR